MGNKQFNKTKIVLIMLGLMASLLMSALDSTIVGTAMKKIVDDLKDIQSYAWPFTIYMLCSTIAIPVFGGLSDIFGRKHIFLSGIVIFLAGSVLSGTSQSMLQLIIYRGLQGIGGGIVVSSVFTIVADLFDAKKRGKYMGIVTSMFGLASVVGPLIGGFLTDNLSWRWIFYINIPIGIAAVILIFINMPNFKTAGVRKSIDIKGIISLTLALIPMLLAFSWAGKDYAWSSVEIIGMLVFSVLMLIVFVFIESKSKNPIIPLVLFKDRAINISMLVAFLTNALMFAAIMFLPYFVQGVLGSSASTSGAITTPMMLALLLTSNITGIMVSKKSKSKGFIILAFVLMSLGTWLLSSMGVTTPYYKVIVFMVILGFGIGITMPIANIAAQNAAPREQLASVTSVVQFFRNIGGTIGSAIFGTIMTTSMNLGLSKIDLSHVPENVQPLLRNPQIITDTQAMSQIKAHVPNEYMDYFNGIFNKLKTILSDSIHDVFFFCIFIAVAGIIIAFLFKEAGKRPAASGLKVKSEVIPEFTEE